MVPNGTVLAARSFHTGRMPKKGNTRRALMKLTNKQTLASVKKEMKLPRKSQSVRDEETTHHHVKLQRRRVN
jgi:hypothetical protein